MMAKSMRGALGRVGDLLGTLDGLLEVVVAPAGVVGHADGRAGEQGGKEVVRIAIVTNPSKHNHAIAVSLAGFLEVFAPFH